MSAAKQLSVFIENRHGRLVEVLQVLKENSISILSMSLADTNIGVEYMYGLSIDGAEASVVMKTSDLDAAEDVLENNGISFLTCEEIAKM